MSSCENRASSEKFKKPLQSFYLDSQLSRSWMYSVQYLVYLTVTATLKNIPIQTGGYEQAFPLCETKTKETCNEIPLS